MSLSPIDIAHYRSEGFVVVRNILSTGEIAELSQACDELSALATNFTEDAYNGVTFFNLLRDCDPFDPNLSSVPQMKGILRRVTYPYALSQTVNRLRAHPRLIEACASLLGDDIVQLVNQINFNPPGLGTGWGWHQDYRFRRQGLQDFVKGFVQCVMAIDPSSSANGGIRLIPKSHELGPLILDQNPADADRYFDPATAVTPTLSAGDAVLFNAYVVHGSSPNRSSRDRRVFINGFADATLCQTHGIPVMRHGQLVTQESRPMEFEEDLAKLPLASKY